MDSDADDVNVVAAGGLESGDLRRLPKPPVLRIEDKWVNTFAVLGSNVIGMSPGLRNTYDSRSDGDTLTFDTKTGDLALLPDLPNGLRQNSTVLAISAGDDRLYVIEDGTVYYDDNEFGMGGLHCLKLQQDDDDDTVAHGYRKYEHRWSWCRASSYLYSSTWWFWSCDPKEIPLTPDGITAHAVHPAGRAFFVSVHCYHVKDHRGRGTFSYDTEHGYWTCHGDWELPFVGQAHYDQGLNAWVGLHVQRDEHRGFIPDGHICACEVPSLNGLAEPDWKLGTEKLFLEEPERHLDAKLVAIGGGGRFCLVEIMTMPGVDREECVGDGEKCVLRLTVFRVKYDDDGELTITDRRPARSFRMSKYKDCSVVVLYF
nr:unnamed protein product [Digitaria exilis]